MDSWVAGLMGTPVPVPTERGRVVLMGGREATPWDLTRGQMDVLDALVTFHTTRSVADVLGVSIKTVEAQLYTARGRMSARSNVQAALMWDEYRRGAPRGIE